MRRKTLLLQIIAFIGFLIIVGGVGIGVYLASKPQDTRQRASEQGLVDITINPTSSTYTTSDPASVQIMVDSGPNVVKIEKLDFVLATLTGDIPDDVTFDIAPLPGVVKVSTTIVDANGGKEIRATLTNPSNSYSTQGANVPLGTLKFTPKATGSMTVTLHPSAAEAVKGVLGNETIRLGGAATYTFAQPTPSPSPTPAAVPAPSAAAAATPAALQSKSVLTKNASVTVCMVVAQNGTFLSEWSSLSPETVRIELGKNPPVSGATGDGKATGYGTTPETLVFSTEDVAQKETVLGTTGVCKKMQASLVFTVGQQPALHVTYKQAQLQDSSQFLSITYNDQWSNISTISSTQPYTSVLFDKDSTNDAARTFQSDGDIPLTDAKPDRILTFVLDKSTLQSKTQSESLQTLALLSQTSSTPEPTASPTEQPVATVTPIPTQVAETTQSSATATPIATLLAQAQTQSQSQESLSTLQTQSQSTAAQQSSETLPVAGNMQFTIAVLVAGISASLLGIGLFLRI